MLVVALAVLAGAIVQGVVGLGLGLLGAPVVTLLEPSLMPGLLLLLAMVLPLVTLSRERADIDWSGLTWSVPPRVVGTAVGVWLVASVSDRVLSGAIAVVVLGAVLVTARAVVVPIDRRSLLVAGLVSGVTGTTSSIGGPPIALLYQHRPPRQVRTTMAVYFVLGAGLSLVGLTLTGEITERELRLAALMLPVLVAGTLIAGVLRARVPSRAFRLAVLCVCTASAVTLLVRALVG